MMTGKIVLGALAPHPPHLVYAENPPQNEPKAEGGWETLRWGYDKLRASLAKLDYDVIIVLSPHWRTYVGTHVLAHPHFKGLSVDPVFPHLFRYNYDLKVDVALAEALNAEAQKTGYPMKLMKNPDYRIDYGTIVSCHLANPKWDKPIVAISSHSSSAYFSPDVMQEEMLALAKITRAAIEKSGKKVVLLASNSLSHRHFTKEPPLPEDMSHEHIYNHSQYLWDMKLIELFKAGKSKEVFQLMPDFTEQAIGETDSGALSWLLATMNFPTKPAEVHAYGTVIGTGNAIVEWSLT
ncbi:MAG: tRNA U-34 5-methylaminomethyl-2-thiouridine biosynthesis protein [Bdellovibrionaceae bacterium]|nr:tRNA U-34 5-methylaminomethyl-2-thiouridine biosynthesis protein [Pseudobdellovibrionaceae bacterium]